MKTDSQLHQDVSAELDWEPSVNATQIGVEVKDQRQSIARSIRHLMGVVGVSNQITIKPQASLDSVKSGIKAALNRRAQADVQNITVEVVGDRVTLSGTVFSWSERDLAEHSAWCAPGVRNVVDNLTIAY